MKQASVQSSRGFQPSTMEDFLYKEKHCFAELDDIGLFLWRGIFQQGKKISLQKIKADSLNDEVWRAEYQTIYKLLFLVRDFHLGNIPTGFWQSLATKEMHSLFTRHRARDLEQQLNIVAGDLVITLMNKKIHLLQLQPEGVVAVAAFFARQLKALSEAECVQKKMSVRGSFLFYVQSVKELSRLHQRFHSF